MTITLQDHGPDTFGLYRDGKRIAVLSECDLKTAEAVANAIRPKTSGLIARVKALEKQVRELRSALGESMLLHGVRNSIKFFKPSALKRIEELLSPNPEQFRSPPP